MCYGQQQTHRVAAQLMGPRQLMKGRRPDEDIFCFRNEALVAANILFWKMILGCFIRRQLPTVRLTATILFVSHTLVDTKVNNKYWQTGVASTVESSSSNLSSSAVGGFRSSGPLLVLLQADHNKYTASLSLASQNNQNTTSRKMSGCQDGDSNTGEASNSAPTNNNEKDPYLPTMIVFDLDGTYDFFSFEPNGPR